MANDHHTKLGDRMTFATVERQGRVRLSGEFLQPLLTEWGTEGTVPCAGNPGRYGGYVFVASQYLESGRAIFDTDDAAGFDNYVTEDGRSILNEMLTVDAPLVYEEARKRYALTLPDKARKSKMVPLPGEVAAVFVLQNTLQVWSQERFSAFAAFRQDELDDFRYDVLKSDARSLGGSR